MKQNQNLKSFISISGTFICQRCREEVYQLRLWKDTLDLTWQCSGKHISRVNIGGTKKTKKDYENERSK